MVMGANTFVTFSSVLFYYAMGTEDMFISAVQQVVAGFSATVMFVLPLFSGPEQQALDENTFADSVRHDMNQLSGGHATNNSRARVQPSAAMGSTMVSRDEDSDTVMGMASSGSKPRRRQSVSHRLWDTMTTMREVANSTTTRLFSYDEEESPSVDTAPEEMAEPPLEPIEMKLSEDVGSLQSKDSKRNKR